MRVYLPKPMSEKLKKIQKDSNGCWLWQGSVDKDGYGRMRGSVDGVVWSQLAHRASFEHFIGPVPVGLHVLHKCDVTGCINPDHLYAGTPKQNGEDKQARGRARTTPQKGSLNGMYGRCGPLNTMYGKQHTPESIAKMKATRLNNNLRRLNV